MARLSARPGTPSVAATPGATRLGLGGARDGTLYVPPGMRTDRPAPVLVMLHGAGRSATEMVPFYADADLRGLVLLVPESRGATWDLTLDGDYGPDVEFIDRALAHTFARVTVDPERLTLAGFSDGASYALSLGLTNGDLFRRIIAFSPGFMRPATRRGKPRVFVSHGTADPVLRVETTSRRIVPQLRQAQYDVVYREFEGGHSVPPLIAREAMEWLVPEGSRATG